MLMIRQAWRNIFRNIRRSVLTCTLIASSLVVIILVDSIINSMTGLMVKGITETIEGEAQIYHSGFRDQYDPELYIRDPKSIISNLDSDNEIKSYASRVIVPSMIGSSYNTDGVVLYGVDAEKESNTSRLQSAVIEGDYLSGSDRELILGRLIAEKLEVGIGDRIVITSSEINTNQMIQELFRVSGIVQFGPKELDEGFAFINLSTAQRMFNIGEGVHQIAIRFTNPELANSPDLDIYKTLPSDTLEAKGWLALQPGLGAMLEMTGLSTLIMGAILFILASLGVVNSIFMSIYERTYELAVSKAIGTRPSGIASLVLLEGLFLALISCFFGIIITVILGIFLKENGLSLGVMEFSGVAFPDNIPVILTLDQFVNFPFYVVLLTLLAAIYPAIFAARIVPAQAVQKAL
ncbi:MAG: FtsX-like permease family protein [Pseudomonadota bacterium]|nr:FtsX-like permease family protein [Pseudomonadota bacterium]